MRLLWQRYGRDFYRGKANGIEESEVEALFVEATGADLSELFAEGVRGTRDLPLEALLEPFGVTLEADVDAKAKPSLGARVRNGADCTLATVYDGGAAQKAGLSAGDVLIAIDGLRVTGSNLDALLSRYVPGAKVEVHAFRRDELRVSQVKLDGPDVSRYKLTPNDRRASASKARKRWLGK
jgi:predicted metalloprotease with PDZ domain